MLKFSDREEGKEDVAFSHNSYASAAGHFNSNVRVVETKSQKKAKQFFTTGEWSLIGLVYRCISFKNVYHKYIATCRPCIFAYQMLLWADQILGECRQLIVLLTNVLQVSSETESNWIYLTVNWKIDSSFWSHWKCCYMQYFCLGVLGF